jgi:hypothetical protein
VKRNREPEFASHQEGVTGHSSSRFPFPIPYSPEIVRPLSIAPPLVRRLSMKVMIIVKATKDSEAGQMPDEGLLRDMMKYNEELAKAGVLLDLAGLQPSSRGARVRFSGRERTVIDGPFAETKELVAGFWVLQVKSLAEAVEWAKRCPNPMPGESELEIRPFFEMSDFPEASADTIALAEQIERQIKPA